MDKYEEMSARIIDMVEEAMLNQHPEVKLHTKIAKESGIEDPAVVCGGDYYTLEMSIAKLLRKFKRRK